MLGDGLEFKIINASASSDFHKTDLVESPPSLDLPYSANTNYDKLAWTNARRAIENMS
jgi:hypothetical protein